MADLRSCEIVTRGIWGAARLESRMVWKVIPGSVLKKEASGSHQRGVFMKEGKIEHE